MERSTSQETCQWLGWLMLAGVITLFPVLLVDVLVLNIHPTGAGWLLLFRVSFAAGLVGTGAVALICRRPIGYFLIYFATAISFWTWLVPYIPVPQRWLPFAEKNCLVTPVLDFFAILILGFAHVRLASEKIPASPSQRMAARVGFFILATLFLIGWSRQYEFLSGRAGNVQEIPVAGRNLEQLATEPPVQFRGVVLKSEGGLMLVFTGKAAREDFLAFAEKMKLTAIPASQSAKFLKLGKQWRLDGAGYPLAFGNDDLFFSGRISGGKSNLQICQKTDTGEFTGQIIAAHFSN